LAKSATEQVLALLGDALDEVLGVADADGDVVGLFTAEPNDDATMSRMSASKPLPDPIATCLK
jgi:hypothetical protein